MQTQLVLLKKTHYSLSYMCLKNEVRLGQHHFRGVKSHFRISRSKSYFSYDSRRALVAEMAITSLKRVVIVSFGWTRGQTCTQKNISPLTSCLCADIAKFPGGRPTCRRRKPPCLLHGSFSPTFWGKS